MGVLESGEDGMRMRIDAGKRVYGCVERDVEIETLRVLKNDVEKT